MLPVFLERGWKRLKRLEIRGVGHWKDEEPVMTMETRKAIKEAVGRDVKVVIEEDWKRPAWMAGVSRTGEVFVDGYGAFLVIEDLRRYNVSQSVDR